MKAARIFVALVVVIATIAISAWVRTQIQVDSCLDNGGRWIEERSICEGMSH